MEIDPVIFQTFKFKKPIEIEEAKFGYGVIASNRKTIIQMEQDIPTQLMPIILARAKLAEINPLIVTLPIPEDSPQDELSLDRLFEYLCEPIREAWTWKILRRYAPTIHKEYFQRLAAAMEGPKGGIFCDLIDLLNALCILEEGGSTGLHLIVDKRGQKYVDSLVEFSKMEPDASLYEELAYRLGGPHGMIQVGGICFGSLLKERQNQETMRVG